MVCGVYSEFYGIATRLYYQRRPHIPLHLILDLGSQPIQGPAIWVVHVIVGMQGEVGDYKRAKMRSRRSP